MSGILIVMAGRNLLKTKDFSLSGLEGDGRKSLHWALPNANDLRLSAVFPIRTRVIPRSFYPSRLCLHLFFLRSDEVLPRSFYPSRLCLHLFHFQFSIFNFQLLKAVPAFISFSIFNFQFSIVLTFVIFLYSFYCAGRTCGDNSDEVEPRPNRGRLYSLLICIPYGKKFYCFRASAQFIISSAALRFASGHNS
jgi:hypothetical protein